MGYGPPGGWNAGMPRPRCGSACGGGSAWAVVAVRACGPIYSVFLFAWVGHIGLRLCDLIVHRRRPVGGAPPCRMANAGRCDSKKKKKKKTHPQPSGSCQQGSHAPTTVHSMYQQSLRQNNLRHMRSRNQRYDWDRERPRGTAPHPPHLHILTSTSLAANRATSPPESSNTSSTFFSLSLSPYSLKLATGLGGVDGAVSGSGRRPRSLLLRHRASL